MAPMTRNKSPGGIPTDEVVAYYERRARGEVGLIITEGVEVSHDSSSAYPDVPRLDSVNARDGWKKVVEAIKKNDGAVIAQLWHCGGFRKKGMGPVPEVPGFTASGLTRPEKNVAHAMDLDDIQQVIDAYAQDAKWCEEIGFDGVEIHGAHGYLIDNFFWSGTNKREDVYGGELENRSQLAADITAAIRAKVSKEFIVGLRFSQWKQQDYEARLASTPEELKRVLTPPAEAGLDYLHSSMRRFWESEFDIIKPKKNRKGKTGLPTISVGSVGLDGDFIDRTFYLFYLESIEDISDVRILIPAVGRALISDPEWVIKMKEGRLQDVIPYTKVGAILLATYDINFTLIIFSIESLS